jgi:hypothetical protein
MARKGKRCDESGCSKRGHGALSEKWHEREKGGKIYEKEDGDQSGETGERGKVYESLRS